MVNDKELIFKNLINNWLDKDNKYVNYSKIYKMKRHKEIPHPFVKWAGGKRQLISQMKYYFPKTFNKYIEPFVGGGALFFYLYRNNLINSNAILIDKNSELINTYKVIKYKVNDLITSMGKHKNKQEYYYKIRGWDREHEFFNNISDVLKASRTIYMNKCCYNGLYRVNNKGQFNVPFGKYKNPNFCDEINLKAVNKALKNSKIYHRSFELCLKFAEKGDFVYFDPPYHPLSETSSFTSYTKENFGIEYQKKLFEVYRELDNRGCKLMLSNSYSEFILNLYNEYDKIILKAIRAINSNATRRGNIKEILVINNYDY